MASCLAQLQLARPLMPGSAVCCLTLSRSISDLVPEAKPACGFIHCSAQTARSQMHGAEDSHTQYVLCAVAEQRINSCSMQWRSFQNYSPTIRRRPSRVSASRFFGKLPAPTRSRITFTPGGPCTAQAYSHTQPAHLNMFSSSGRDESARVRLAGASPICPLAAKGICSVVSPRCVQSLSASKDGAHCVAFSVLCHDLCEILRLVVDADVRAQRLHSTVSACHPDTIAHTASWPACHRRAHLDSVLQDAAEPRCWLQLARGSAAGLHAASRHSLPMCPK